MQGDLPLALLLATLAGAAIPVGGALAMLRNWVPNWLDDELRHSVMAFGGGALFSAVALVLVPEGIARLAPPFVLVWFGLGGIAFWLADRALARRGGHAAQFMAMMLDYIPEAMALGALLAGDPALAALLAALIALQNLPEGFSAFREMQTGWTRSLVRLWLLFLAMVPLGPLAAWAGLSLLADAPQMLGGIMLFASGGILYLLFEDVAPQVPLERHWGPPLGAVVGFMVGLAGHLYTI